MHNYVKRALINHVFLSATSSEAKEMIYPDDHNYTHKTKSNENKTWFSRILCHSAYSTVPGVGTGHNL